MASRAKGGARQARQARQALLPRPQSRPIGQRICRTFSDRAWGRVELAHGNIGHRVLPQIEPPEQPPPPQRLPATASYGVNGVIL